MDDLRRDPMSHYDLRDISEKLSGSKDTTSVISSFLSYLQTIRGDWKASLAFYECSTDRLVSIYSLEGGRLMSADLDLPVDSLPAKLVRKFFHHSTYFADFRKRTVLSLIFQNSPYYRADRSEAPALAAITPLNSWESCLCMPMADSEDIIALLTVCSAKKNAFPSKAVGELLPVKSVATLALAQHLYRSEKGRLEEEVKSVETKVATRFEEKLHRLTDERLALQQANEDQARMISELVENLGKLDEGGDEYRVELERVKHALFALEEQSSVATEYLADAYAELSSATSQLADVQGTMQFTRGVCDLLAQEHNETELPALLISWFADYFGIERFSYMTPDARGETLQISLSRGIAANIAERVRVRIGQGIAGWVAHNRKPLLVRAVGEAGVPHTHQDNYNSDSFLSVPVVHNDTMFGVLNLSNKRDGSLFGQPDLDRAMLLSQFVAMSQERVMLGRKAQAWAA
jgi:transcriptional regulator with GAF, ATPase, and Fis domain